MNPIIAQQLETDRHAVLDAGTYVGVIIVHWKRRDLLERCLSALDEQTAPPGRVLIVENGSEPTDDLDDRFDLTLERLRLDDNIGFAGAVNQAAEHLADRRFLVLLNDDAFPAEDWIEELVAEASVHPEATCIASLMVDDDDPATIDGAGDCYHLCGYAWRRLHGQPTPSDLDSGEVFSACAGAMLVKRDAFLRLGGFDESYYCYFEDVDFGFRMRLSGMHSRLARRAVVRHVGSGSTARHGEFGIYYGHRNATWTFIKNMPWPLLVTLWPLHVLASVAALLIFTTRGQGGAIWRAKVDALRRLPEVLRQRRVVQRQRRAPWWRLWSSFSKGRVGVGKRGRRVR